MIKKLVLLFLLFLISFSSLISQIGTYTLSKPVKVKLKNYKKFETYLLCFTDKGFVTCSNSYFSVNEVSEFAEYHTFEELSYFQLPGKFNLYPLLIGGTISLVTLATAEKDPNEEFIPSEVITSAIVMLGSLVLTLFTPFFPRTEFTKDKKDSEKFPDKYVTFKNDIPIELQEFIDTFEE